MCLLAGFLVSLLLAQKFTVMMMVQTVLCEMLKEYINYFDFITVIPHGIQMGKC